MTLKPFFSEKDFVILPKPNEATNEIQLDIHPLPDRNALLIKVQPPKEPVKALNHVPCDVVLVIDVSGSMSAEAPAPTTDPAERERNGLTVLDLTKHAARTILETLDENDRLGLVTFSTEAKVVQNLLPMTKRNKGAALQKIESLKVDSMTNLWHGLLEGIKLFHDDERTNSVASIMVLTDGMPNHMCPPQGYIAKLQQYELPATINTFGFGYSIRSGLLKSIAEIGGGNYSFIPDAGMIGTVFVHAIANLQSTYATAASLTIITPRNMRVSETLGGYVRMKTNQHTEVNFDEIRNYNLSIPLGNLQYGQSRDIYLTYDGFSVPNTIVEAYLDYLPLDNVKSSLQTARNINEHSFVLTSEAIYHEFRAKVCNFLSTLSPLNGKNGEHEHLPVREIANKRKELQTLINDYKSKNLIDEYNQSLLEDLCGDNPSGQIQLAISTDAFYNRWGKHYLPSLQNAYAKQICNSFKDCGPLQFGKDSPLFTKCRNELDRAFDTLPAPKPSVVVQDEKGNAVRGKVNMSSYHRRGNPCFAAECHIKLEDGSVAPIDSLKKGLRVWTPVGSRVIVEIVATEVRSQKMCVIGKSLVITPWHPVYIEGKWKHPNDIAEKQITYSGTIYSLLLEEDDCTDAHSVEIGDILAVTLGHGVTGINSDDVRAHTFLGDYGKVLESIQRLPTRSGGIRSSQGMRRNSSTGLVCEFLGAMSGNQEYGNPDTEGAKVLDLLLHT